MRRHPRLITSRSRFKQCIFNGRGAAFKIIERDQSVSSAVPKYQPETPPHTRTSTQADARQDAPLPWALLLRFALELAFCAIHPLPGLPSPTGPPARAARRRLTSRRRRRRQASRTTSGPR